jgi:hypothetical protein
MKISEEDNQYLNKLVIEEEIFFSYSSIQLKKIPRARWVYHSFLQNMLAIYKI